METKPIYRTAPGRQIYEEKLRLAPVKMTDTHREWCKRQNGGMSAYIRRLIEADMKNTLKG